MNGRNQANYSFNSFVVAAENQSFKAAESFCEAEYIDVDQPGEDDEYGLNCSPETLELLRGLSQQARDALDTEAIGKVEAEPRKMRSRAEEEASQRLRGKAELERNKLPSDLTANRFREHDPVPTMVRIMKAIRKNVEASPECIDTGIKRMLQEFQDDEILCTRLAISHFSSDTAKIFCTGVVPMTGGWPSPDALPLVWRRTHASDYPSLREIESGKEKGLHVRGVYLLQSYENWRSKAFHYYVGSGRSAQGGILLRALQHGDPEYRARNSSLYLYKHLNRPGIWYRIYRLSDWPAISEVPGKDDTFDEILLMEKLWQIRLRTGVSGKMSGFFRAVQDSFDGDTPVKVMHKGLNVYSALEKTRKYPGAANRSFS